MEKVNIGLIKSEDFGAKIMNLYPILTARKVPFRVREQLVGSGTSIGANLFEAQYGISSKDFLAKVYISLKECYETIYWLRLLYRTDYISNDEFTSYYSEAEEILKILITTTKTLKQNSSE